MRNSKFNFLFVNKKYELLIEVALGFLLAYLLILWFFGGERHFENLALGVQTMPYMAKDENNIPIHIGYITDENEQLLLNGWKMRGKKNVVMILGNSQSHSINQKKDNEVNFVELLHRGLPDLDILCQSIPNANLQEFYLSLMYWKQKIPVKLLVVPLFMDDFREDGIRDVFFKGLIKNKFLISDTGDIVTIINNQLKGYWKNDNDTSSALNSDFAALRQTYQEKSETSLNNYLNHVSKAWNYRANVRGEFFVWLYKARNTLFGIKANTKRKMIPQRYTNNMEALDKIIQGCLRSNIKIFFYIPPIRNDVELPYDHAEYDHFKKSIAQSVSHEPDMIFLKNFEGIVPGYLWGFKEATNLTSEKEVDYMHFQYKGHQIMADSIELMIKKIEGL